MPYVFHEESEMQEGWESVDVIERGDYDALVSERDKAVEQRDQAVERAATAEAEVKKQKAKYAEAFLTSPARIKEDTREHLKREQVRAQSIDDLF